MRGLGVVDAIDQLDPHDAALTAAALRRCARVRRTFEHTPEVLAAIIFALEERAAPPPSSPGGGGAVVRLDVERARRRPAAVTVEGQASPLRRVRSQRALVLASELASHGLQR